MAFLNISRDVNFGFGTSARGKGQCFIMQGDSRRWLVVGNPSSEVTLRIRGGIGEYGRCLWVVEWEGGVGGSGGLVEGGGQAATVAEPPITPSHTARRRST